MKSPLFLFLLLPITASAASGGEFEGCKGLKVTRSRDLSQVDVSDDLQKAQKRIKEICGKVLPGKLKAIDANAKSCLAGANAEIGPGLANNMKNQMQAQMNAFADRVKTACDAMKSAMEEAKRFCRVRKSSLENLNRAIATLDKAESDQTSSLKNVANLYGSAVGIYETTSKEGGEAKNRIYAQLPDKDEARAAQMRQGNESASTQDPKTDKLISEWQSTLTLLAKDNKNKSSCGKLAAKGGQLDEVGKILKNNLWPNGKVAARAIARVEGSDKEKAAEFSAKKAEAEERAYKAKMAEAYSHGYEPGKGSDISGTEKNTPRGPEKMNAADWAEMQKKDEEAQIKKAKALKAYSENGSGGAAAIQAAMAEAEKTNEIPEDFNYESAAKRALNGNLGINSNFPAEYMDPLNRENNTYPVVGGTCIKKRESNRDILGIWTIYYKCE